MPVVILSHIHGRSYTWALSVYMYFRHKCFHTLFDLLKYGLMLLKYGLMSKYNVMCSSLDPMEELTASPPYPSWSRAWAWVICLPHKLEILGSITEIECTLLSGSAEQDALTMKESPLKNLILATPLMGVVAK